MTIILHLAGLGKAITTSIRPIRYGSSIEEEINVDKNKTNPFITSLREHGLSSDVLLVSPMSRPVMLSALNPMPVPNMSPYHMHPNLPRGATDDLTIVIDDGADTVCLNFTVMLSKDNDDASLIKNASICGSVSIASAEEIEPALLAMVDYLDDDTAGDNIVLTRLHALLDGYHKACHLPDALVSKLNTWVPILQVIDGIRKLVCHTYYPDEDQDDDDIKLNRHDNFIITDIYTMHGFKGAYNQYSQNYVPLAIEVAYVPQTSWGEGIVRVKLSYNNVTAVDVGEFAITTDSTVTEIMDNMVSTIQNCNFLIETTPGLDNLVEHMVTMLNNAKSIANLALSNQSTKL